MKNTTDTQNLCQKRALSDSYRIILQKNVITDLNRTKEIANMYSLSSYRIPVLIPRILNIVLKLRKGFESSARK